MKHVLLIYILSLLSTSVFGQKNNPLLNTKWKFKGYIINRDSSLRACPDNVNYFLEFKEDHKVSGVAGPVKCQGKYKIKKDNKVLIRLSVPKGSPPGYFDPVEFEWRLDYAADLGFGRADPYKIQGDQLKIFSGQYVTMLFELEK